jgi:hypothetical protein
MASACPAELTLGRVTTNPSGRPPWPSRAPRNRSSVRTPRRRVAGLEALEADAAKGRCAGRRGEHARGAQGVGVLLAVAAVAVAVLEVDPQILDGLGSSLPRTRS